MTMVRQVEFNFLLKHPFTCMVAGPNQCGKTQSIVELIFRSSSIHPLLGRTVWRFGCYREFCRNGDGIEFVEDVPDMNILDGSKKRTLLIVDDIMSGTDTRVIKIFTKESTQQTQRESNVVV